MPQVAEDQLRRELAAVVVVMSHHIAIWSNDLQLAARFGGWDEDAEPKIEDVDLDGFWAAKQVLGAYHYAFHPTSDDVHDTQALYELQEILSGLPREDFHGDARDFPSYRGPSAIEDTVHAAHARAAIDGIDNGLTASLSVRQLALLADMTEGAVRNAMTQSGEARLAAILGEKPVRFEIEEARRWLEGRRGYRATPKGMADDPLMDARLRSFERMEQLTDFIERHARRNHEGTEGLARALGWDARAMSPWLEGCFQFDAKEATDLARTLGADEATFAGKALELSLRRDRDGKAA